MDPEADIESLTDKLDDMDSMKNEKERESPINQNTKTDVRTNELTKESFIPNTNNEVTDGCQMNEEVAATGDEMQERLSTRNLESTEVSSIELSDETVSEEGNLQRNELTLEENNANVTDKDCNTVQSESLHENITETVSQEESSETTLVSNVVEKDDTDNLLNDVSITECTESEKASLDAVEEMETETTESTAVDDACDSGLIEKETDSSTLDTPRADKIQMSVNEKDNSSNKETDSEIVLNDCDKDVAEKSVVEPENTEFVQFSQEKHGDVQIENQSIDAEDPFGGDNLNTENIEPMDTDDLTETEVGFSKLCSQVDNLQDVVSAREDNLSSNSKDKEKDESVSVSTLQLSAVIENGEKNRNENSVAVDGSENIGVEVTKSTEKSNEGIKKTVDGATPMETEEQSNVLPGQDDELCIIPDSMKVIIPGHTEKSNSDNNQPLDEVNHESSEATQNPQDNTSITDIDKNSEQNENELTITHESSKKDTENSQNEKDLLICKKTVVTEDVINIDDESKNSEIQEITATESCKQCNERRSCKIKVKVGFDTYTVCSKTCKALFKAANNRSVDIPSDGVNSKREKRCANCLLIVEHNDERNLSWETMEFCNEECLGKFQTKYGSYCRNCNGSVQAVSLGKYCVRFGYDVRQFCCSTCLEEFKKGLKVCTYCQKDISSSAEGFLAPVGDKGQFKDFCTQDCMEKYSRMSSVEPINMEKKCCSVCQEVRRHCYFFKLYIRCRI